MGTLRIIIYVGCFSIFCLATMLAIKNCNTMKQHIVIETAIFRYNFSHRGDEIPHTVVEPYTKTLYRVGLGLFSDSGFGDVFENRTVYSKSITLILQAPL